MISVISGVMVLRPRCLSADSSSGARADMMTVSPVLTRLQAKPFIASSREMVIFSRGRFWRICWDFGVKASGQ